MLKFSIVTVSFNSAATIGRTLRSVAGQSWTEVEHIVIDGASSDGTPAVVARDGAHVAHLVSERDRGIYDAMNKGVAAASGDVIAFLNADDHYADFGVLARVARVFDAGEFDAVYGDVGFFRADAPNVQVRRFDSSRFSPARLAWGWMPAHPALFLRRRVFDATGPFSLDYRIAADFEFIVRAFRDGTLRYSYLPEVLVRMQMGGVSTSGWRSTLLLNREMMRACITNSVRTSWPRLLSRYPLKLIEFVRAR